MPDRNTLPPRRYLFPLGQVLATPGAAALLERTGGNAFEFLERHQCGDWGSVPAEEVEENQFALDAGDRILSSYFLNETERLWIITEADRLSTTLLLLDEY